MRTATMMATASPLRVSVASQGRRMASFAGSQKLCPANFTAPGALVSLAPSRTAHSASVSCSAAAEGEVSAGTSPPNSLLLGKLLNHLLRR
jgi:hypothetical protein